MNHRIGKKNFRIFAFDVESHNDIESIIKQETSIWLSCFIDETSKASDESIYFYTIESFLDKLEELSHPKRKHDQTTKECKNIAIYIYNLSFEWSFILPKLLERGFKFKEDIGKDDSYSYNSISTKSVSSVWEVKLKFKKTGGDVLLRDLAKIYGGGLGKVAKSFNLETQKGEIDYRYNRLREPKEAKKIEKYINDNKLLDNETYRGFNAWLEVCSKAGVSSDYSFKYTPTEEERIYCFKDTRIIIDILLKIIERGDKDFFNIISMASFSMKKLIKFGYPKSLKPMKDFRKEYPLLEKEETDFLRESVGGGITYAPRLYQFKDIRQRVVHIDLHQAHPSSCYFNYFPYGVGEYHKGEPPKDFFKINCCRIKLSYTGVRLHCIIKLIGLPFVDDKELVVWDFEIPLIKECYIDAEIKYIDYYSYKSKRLRWRQYYAYNYNERLKAKKKKDDFLTLYYKLLNNSSYGKLLEKPHNSIFQNVIREDGVIDSNIIEKEEIKDNAKYTYLPVGSCIPAYTRRTLVSTALKIGWEYITYFDTDSIFFIETPETLRVWEEELSHKDFLGGWGLEEIVDRAQFTAPKRYKTEVNGEVTIKAGGINFKNYIEEQAEKIGIKAEDYKVTFDEINIISSSWKVQRAYRVKGGTLVEFQLKAMDIQKKYATIYEENKKDI